MSWMIKASVIVAASAWLGCSSHASYCEDFIDCAGGNDQDQEACVIQLDADEDVADIEGCSDDYAELFDCREENAHCTGDNDWTDDGKCQEQQDKYDRCRF